MALFNFGKKKETTCCDSKKTNAPCACQNQCKGEEQSSRFIVLGACCKRSADSFENVKQAVKELGFEDEVQNLGDDAEIARYGVMQTPALVIEGKVVTYGRLIKQGDARELILKAGIKP